MGQAVISQAGARVVVDVGEKRQALTVAVDDVVGSAVVGEAKAEEDGGVGEAVVGT